MGKVNQELMLLSSLSILKVSSAVVPKLEVWYANKTVFECNGGVKD